MNKFTRFLLLGVAFAAANASAQTIINTNFNSTGSNQLLNGSTVGLSTNLPGGNWVWGAGLDFAAPLVPATWLGGFQNTASLQNETTAVGISIASSGGYVKPIEFTLTTDVILSGSLNNTAGVGFWSSMPPQVNFTSPFNGFTGLVLNEVNGTLQVYSGGALTGSAVSVGSISEGVAYTISYSVNTSTGAISNVTFEGATVAGLSSSAFTDSATVYAGVLSGNASRTNFDDFSVVQAVPEPSAVLMVALGGFGMMLNVRRARRQSIS